jgi:hypothetical protein
MWSRIVGLIVVALLVVTVLAEEILIRDYNGPEEQVINF